MRDPWERLPREFYLRDTVETARDLLGRYLVRRTPEGLLACRITETEAYCGPEDPACHSYRRKAPKGRTNIMYRAGGLAYIYLIYGMYCCFNVVTRQAGEPEAVLVRAAQPLLGLPQMAANRRMDPECFRERALLSGPGKLCQGLAITRDLYGEPLWGEELWLTQGEPVPPEKIAATPRINVDYAGEAALWPWRFVERPSGR